MLASNFKFILFGLIFIQVKSMAQNSGIFEGHKDVGKMLHKGSVHYNSESGDYVLTASGKNIWFNDDEFYFVWKKLKGDLILQARAHFIGQGHDPHRKYIYFNSAPSGIMQIWRMDADGSHQVQITSDEYNNWFPHISPDGKWILFLSFTKDVKPEDHPFYKQVYLRLMPVNGGQPKVAVYLYGGQGSINTPSWSTNSKQFAFVSNSGLILKK